MFAVAVADRSAATLNNVIEHHVIPGSTIVTDCWRGYNYLDNSNDYLHTKVNHSLHFRDPISGEHTNSIEGTWSTLKAKISKRYRCEECINNHILVFIWRRQNFLNLWEALLLALSEYHWIE